MEFDLRDTLTPSCCPYFLDTPGTHLFLWLPSDICGVEVEIYFTASSTSVQTQAASSPIPMCFYAHAMLHPCLCLPSPYYPLRSRMQCQSSTLYSPSLPLVQPLIWISPQPYLFPTRGPFFQVNQLLHIALLSGLILPWFWGTSSFSMMTRQKNMFVTDIISKEQK